MNLKAKEMIPSRQKTLKKPSKDLYSWSVKIPYPPVWVEPERFHKHLLRSPSWVLWTNYEIPKPDLPIPSSLGLIHIDKLNIDSWQATFATVLTDAEYYFVVSRNGFVGLLNKELENPSDLGLSEDDILFTSEILDGRFHLRPGRFPPENEIWVNYIIALLKHYIKNPPHFLDPVVCIDPSRQYHNRYLLELF